MTWTFKVNGSTRCQGCKASLETKPLSSCPVQHSQYYAKRRLIRPREKRAYWESLRVRVLSHYGGRCACPPCGYSNLNKKIRGKSFLQMDHVNGNGGEHRKIMGRIPLYPWLLREKFPPGYRVLCIVCNIAMEPGETVCEYHRDLATGSLPSFPYSPRDG